MKRKTPIIIVACVILWCAAVMMLPGIGHGQLAFPRSVKERLKVIAAECTTFEQAKGKIEEWTGHWIDHHRTNRYMVELTRKDDGGWTLVATPKRTVVYHYSLWKRLLLLDFSKYNCPTYTAQSGSPNVEAVQR